MTVKTHWGSSVTVLGGKPLSEDEERRAGTPDAEKGQFRMVRWSDFSVMVDLEPFEQRNLELPKRASCIVMGVRFEHSDKRPHGVLRLHTGSDPDRSFPLGSLSDSIHLQRMIRPGSKQSHALSDDLAGLARALTASTIGLNETTVAMVGDAIKQLSTQLLVLTPGSLGIARIVNPDDGDKVELYNESRFKYAVSVYGFLKEPISEWAPPTEEAT